MSLIGYKDKALEYYEQCGDYENAQNREGIYKKQLVLEDYDGRY